MKAEYTGREIGESCEVCGKTITEHDGDNSHRIIGRGECSCDPEYLEWHGATGPGKALRDIIAGETA